MLWTKKHGTRAVKAGDLTAFIDEGSEIEGTCTFGGTVMLNGTVRGEVVCTDTIIVGEKGVVHAQLRGGTVVISGQVTGNVCASQRLELRGSARVFGDVEAPIVVMAEGVLFEGHCRMTPREQSAAPPQHDRSVVPMKR